MCEGGGVYEKSDIPLKIKSICALFIYDALYALQESMMHWCIAQGYASFLTIFRTFNQNCI